MTRVATPDNEEQLLLVGRKTTGAQLEKICRVYRPVKSGKYEKSIDEDTSRFVSERFTRDGMVAIQIRVRPDEAPRLLAAFDAFRESGKRVDGAVALAEAALGGTLGADEKVRPPAEVVVHVSAETLTGATELGDGLSEQTCRRMLCDAGVVPMICTSTATGSKWGVRASCSGTRVGANWSRRSRGNGRVTCTSGSTRSCARLVSRSIR